MGDRRPCEHARAEAERQVLLARTDYRTAIRRLQLAGGSLREIADALSSSHQGVQQIVNGAGSSWWTRVWRTPNVTADLVCTWCDRPHSEVARLIAGPNVFICESCLEAAGRAIRVASRPGLKRAGSGAKGRCRKRGGRARAVAVGGAAGVCEACLQICRQILDGRAA
jgi:ClpX C4-type zinc finger